VDAVSHAKPKIADYPFTTLYPALGVVSIDSETSFVVADIPGLIEGAAEGAGLGIQFLKHLQRTGLLLHMVELPAFEEMPEPVEQVRALEHELEKFSNELQGKERWLVFTKSDLMTADNVKIKVKEYVAELNWKYPVFVISSITHHGLKDLNQHIANYLSKANEDIWD